VWWRPGEQGENFIADGFGTTFVGIETEDPIEIAGFNRAVSQVAEPLKLDIDNARAEGSCELRSSVDAERIHNDDLVGPQHAGHRGLDFFGLIKCENIS